MGRTNHGTPSATVIRLTNWLRLSTAERFAVILLLILAWTWIVATVTVLYYGASNWPPLGQSQQPPKQPQQQRLSLVKPADSARRFKSPLIIFTCHRAEYLKQTLEDVFNYIPRNCEMGCPVVISQDGRDPVVAKVAADYQEKLSNVGVPLVHMQHERTSNLRGMNPAQAYEALARHYGWGLTRLFSGEAYPVQQKLWPVPDRVIILEEDLHIAKDFFDYFNATAPLLDSDPTLLAISAFNDNGKRQKVKNETRLLRSDFFPGLGWMMTRKLWQYELNVKWPKAYWDDWLREPQQRQGRHVIRPEVSRTYHFGFEGGASLNQFGTHLSDILLNSEPVDWAAIQPSLAKTLSMDQFDRDYGHVVAKAKLAPDLTTALEWAQTQSVRLEYVTFPDFQTMAKGLKLMDDEKAGVPRTAYRGIVEIRPHGEHFIFLTPPLESLKHDMHID